MKNLILFLLLVLINSLFSQSLKPVFSETTQSDSYNDFAPEIFFGRLPSAKTEAMGRILTLNFDPYFVSQSNPANLATTEGVAGFYSHSTPFYGYNEATYNYAGVSYHHPTIGAFAFNYLLFSSGPTVFIPPWGEPFANSLQEKRYLYTLTYSREIPDWVSFGINANLFVADFGTDETYSTSFFDLGLSRIFSLAQDSQIKDDITLGTQLKNIFNQSFSTFDQWQADALPMIFQIGLANSVEYTNSELYDKSYIIGFTLGFEYQDLFNSELRTAYKAGSELSFIDIVFLRAGYYHETNFSSTDKLEGVTYGAGLKLDFDKLFTKDFPLVLRFDFVSLKQPTYTTIYDDWENFSTFSLIASYELN